MRARWFRGNVVPVSGAASVSCGLVFLWLTGAPLRLLLINLVALGVGVALITIGRLLPAPGIALRRALLLAASLSLVATALFGMAVEGASRWVLVGGLALQPSLILVPVLLLAHVIKPDRWSSAAVAIAACAMALQPDRSLAAAILAVTVVDAFRRRSPEALTTSLAALAGVIATQLQPDLLPAVPYVDQILWTSFAAQPLAAGSLWLGILLLFVPALMLWRGGDRPTPSAFAALWATLVLSAALHNYPTPLVGYGASCILGYLLAALALPGPAARGLRTGRQSLAPAATDEQSGTWRISPSAT